MLRPPVLLSVLTLGVLAFAAPLLTARADEKQPPLPKEIAAQPFEIQHGYTLFQTKCTQCHTLERVSMKTDVSVFDWQSLVGTMAAKEKADIGKSEQQFILIYLAYRNEMAAPAAERRDYEAFVRDCESCHGIGLMYQKRFPVKDWPAIVHRMAGKGGAEISAEDEKLIVAYVKRLTLDLFGID